jgi:hypothetical protein
MLGGWLVERQGGNDFDRSVSAGVGAKTDFRSQDIGL